MTNVYSGLFVDFTTFSWYSQLLPRCCVDWLSLVYRTLPLFLLAFFAEFCRKGFVPLVAVFTVPRREGHVLLGFGYLLLLCHLWMVDLFLLTISLYGLYQLFSPISSSMPALFLDDLLLCCADFSL